MNKSYEKKTTTAHSQNMLHVDVLYKIKRKKYKTACAELAFTKSQQKIIQNNKLLDIYVNSESSYF
jgi:hypothetical protein